MTKPSKIFIASSAHALSLNMPLNNNPQWRLLNRIEKECAAWQGTFDKLYFEAFTEVKLKSISELEEALRQSNQQLKQAELNAKLLHTVKTNLKAYGQATKQIELSKRRLAQFNALSTPQFWEKAQATIEQSNGKTQNKRLARLETLQSLIEDTPYPLLLDTSLQALLESKALFNFHQQLKKYQALLRDELKRLKGSKHKAQCITTASMLAHLEGLSRAVLEQEVFLKQGLIERVLIQQAIQDRTRARPDDVISYVVQELHDLGALTKAQQKNRSWAPVSKTEIKALTQQEQLQFKRLAQHHASSTSFARLNKIIDPNQFTLLADEKVIIPRDMEGLLTPRSGLFASLIDYVMGWRAYGELDFFKTKTPELLTYNQWLKCTTQSLTLPGIEANSWLLQLNAIMAGFDEDTVKNKQQRAQLSRFASAHHRATLEAWGHCIQSYQAHVIARGLDGLEQMFGQLNKTDTLPDKSIQAVQSLLQHFQRCMDSQSASLAPRKLKQRLDTCEQQISEKIHYDDIRKRWSACTTNIAQYCDEMNRGIYLSDAEWKDVAISSSLAYELGGDYWKTKFVKRFEDCMDKLYARSTHFLAKTSISATQEKNNWVVLNQHVTQIEDFVREFSQPVYQGAFYASLNSIKLSYSALKQRQQLASLPDETRSAALFAHHLADFCSAPENSLENKQEMIDKVLAQLFVAAMNEGQVQHWQTIAKTIRVYATTSQKETLAQAAGKYLQSYCEARVNKSDVEAETFAALAAALGSQKDAESMRSLERKRADKAPDFMHSLKETYYSYYAKACVHYLKNEGLARLKHQITEHLKYAGVCESGIELFFKKTHEQESLKNYGKASLYPGEQTLLSWDNSNVRRYFTLMSQVNRELEGVSVNNLWAAKEHIESICQSAGLCLDAFLKPGIDINARLAAHCAKQAGAGLKCIGDAKSADDKEPDFSIRLDSAEKNLRSLKLFIETQGLNKHKELSPEGVVSNSQETVKP